MPEIDWSHAAVVAAVLAGAFALVKELVTFILDRIKGVLDAGGERTRLLGRLGQYYFQVAVGASRALEAWSEAKRQLDQGFGDLPEPPAIEFIDYADPILDQHLADLSVRAPELVSRYLQVDQLRRSAATIFTSEKGAFGNAPFAFSYPRTRRLLRGLLETSVAGLAQVAEVLPEDFWDPCKGPQPTYRRAAKEFTRKLQDIPPISTEEIQQESLVALEKLHSAPVESKRDSERA